MNGFFCISKLEKIIIGFAYSVRRLSLMFNIIICFLSKSITRLF